jgi:hypothetical protein
VRIALTGLEATVDGTLVANRAPDPGPVALGPVEVELDVRTGEGGTLTRWSVTNRADTDVNVRSVAAVYAVDAVEPVRMLRHGYQSWSPTGLATLGHDADPSTHADLHFLQAVHHADQRTVVAPGELRSEWLTVLADLQRAIVVGGFDGAGSHDGTWRLRRPATGARSSCGPRRSSATFGSGPASAARCTMSPRTLTGPVPGMPGLVGAVQPGAGLVELGRVQRGGEHEPEGEHVVGVAVGAAVGDGVAHWAACWGYAKARWRAVWRSIGRPEATWLRRHDRDLDHWAASRSSVARKRSPTPRPSSAH